MRERTRVDRGVARRGLLTGVLAVVVAARAGWADRRPLAEEQWHIGRRPDCLGCAVDAGDGYRMIRATLRLPSGARWTAQIRIREARAGQWVAVAQDQIRATARAGRLARYEAPPVVAGVRHANLGVLA